MIGSYRKLLSLLTPGLRRQFWVVLLVTTLSAILDLIGVAMIIPFLAVLAEPQIVTENAWLAWGYDLVGAESTFGFLQVLGVATFLFVLLGIVLRAGSFYLANIYARKVNLHFGMTRFVGHLAQSYEWYLTQHPSEISKSVLQEINEIIIGTVVTCLRIVPSAAQIAITSAFLLLVEPVATIVIAAVFGASFFVVDLVVRRRLISMGADRMKANRERHQVVGEAVRGIRETKMMALEDGYLRRFEDPSRRLARHQTGVLLIGEMPRYALELITFGGMLAFTLWLLWVRQGALGEIVPLLGAFAFAALKLMPALQLLFRDIAALRYSRTSLEALEADIRNAPARSTQIEGDFALPARSSIELRDVGYTYPGSDRGRAIEDISLRIDAGSTVGIMGSTGSGKSTLVDLLMGLISPSCGQLLIGGTLLTSENRAAWRRMVGFVPQTINLIDAGVAENIARAAAPGEIDMDRVRKAAELARVSDFVDTLPAGYRTLVGEAGVKLSGGQRQRIGIARALYDDRPVLVFDEATSALDALTEREVMESIQSLAGQRTVILVSHRLATLARCDTIFVMRDGRISATGNFDELRRDNQDVQSMLRAAS
ncbi:MAG: ABC transporter ATP-binding protein [Pseudomonadota bacterium]